MIITTARKQIKTLANEAERISRDLDSNYFLRDDRSVTTLVNEYKEDVLIVGKDRLTLYPKDGGQPFFYHPNSAMFRVKQFLKTGYDPLVEVGRLQKGMNVLDCTLGLAADALVAKIAVGECGHVTGIEANHILAYLVRYGLHNWKDGHPYLLKAMKTIEVIHQSHFTFLQSCEDESYDVIYFDPMFESNIESIGLKGLKSFAVYDDLTFETIHEAKRVSKKRIILKDHFQSKRFERFGFHVVKRQHTTFRYGFIEK
ncbi:class I SAM-dependent methyltransferase [Alkalihalobacillus hemicellulosilyticus]|uniref:L-isoD(D-D) O-methyltransferase n=1 Tax=Halalkalibacter hemicellulosilyticusJCM 9152 TaxID=1236971 RepID=W4QFI2_9BACI|nr:class I SAM-dependent methyltransferase [Halalkalibacter hemicellulosilyticus]GAE30841.1 L-isoD(D-D) O-methyltransferase [Halalkalibacter hemicellulosilyticusJCM 9152]